jgi:hypothetical protein
MKFNFNTVILILIVVLVTAGIYFNFFSGQPVTFRQ